MNFYLTLSRNYRRFTYTLHGVNRSNFKTYICCEFGKIEKPSKFHTPNSKDSIKHIMKTNSWTVKNYWHGNLKKVYKDSSFSENFIYAEKSIDLYSDSFAVRIDFINTMNQIMSGMGEIATTKTEHFDWIRVRRLGNLKNQPESAFFKISDLCKFYNKKKSELIKLENVDFYPRSRHSKPRYSGNNFILFPTFTTTIESEEEVFEKLSKHMKKNEKLLV